MSTIAKRSGFHTQFSSVIGGLASRVSLHVRKKMYAEFSKKFANADSILDVGVTSDNVAPEANYFEELHPHKNRITAVGVEDASHLQEKYPGLKFIKIVPNQALPFEDKAFEVVFSNAVIEHIVDEQKRREFLQELMRVGQHVFVTTPNRFFPIEPHTGVPLLHALFPKLFYQLLDRGAFSKFYRSNNLKLMTKNELTMLAGAMRGVYQIIPVRFCGFISNWILIFKN